MIRAGIKEDLEAVYRLMQQLSSHEFTKEQFEDCYSFNLVKRNIFVYEKDHFICGCVIYNIHYYLHFSRKTAEIVSLIVDENYRGQGIGKELLSAIEQIAAGSECVCLEVASGKQREDAHRFYTREGFAFDHYKFTKEL
jgi:PhnO protein